MSEFVESIFGEDLHAKRLRSLSNAAQGVVQLGCLGISVIGRAVAAARGTPAKFGIKQVDRLVGNAKLDVWELFSSWIPYVAGARSEVWVALDWTEYDADKQATLSASLVSSHGRATPLLWLSEETSALKGKRLAYERKLLTHLKECLPSTVTRIVVIADRGFGDSDRVLMLRELGIDFVVRIRGTVSVTDDSGIRRGAAEWLSPSGRAVKLTNVTITDENVAVGAFVAVRDPGMKDGWYLVSSLADLPARQLISCYGRRFTIEESFRDIKDLRFGMGLANLRA